MSLTDVTCKTNEYQIKATAENVIDNKTHTFIIEPKKALIDDNGMIRFFTKKSLDGKSTIGYILHPYKKQHHKNIAWVTKFFLSFGLSRARGELFKTPNGTNPVLREAVNVGTYFVFATLGDYVVTSFIESEISQPELELGYHHHGNDNLIWKGPLYVKV